MSRLLKILLGACGFALISSVVSFVDTKEVAVIYRFGEMNRIVESGIHMHLPFPIESMERLSIRNTRSVELGSQLALTGDANLVNINTIAQFEVMEVSDFVLQHKDVDATVQKILQATTIRVLGQSAVDQESFLNRVLLEQEIQSATQVEIDKRRLGVELTSLGIEELSAPKAVIDAFNEISSARGEKDTMILSAESYASKRIPDARGEAKKVVEQAKAKAFEIESLAKARVFYFEQMLPIYRKDSDLLRKTLRTETWQRIASKVTVHQLSGQEDLVLPVTTNGDKP